MHMIVCCNHDDDVSPCLGGIHPEYDPDPGSLSHAAQLPGRGLLPARQPLHRPVLLRQSLQTRAPRTDLCWRQSHKQGKNTKMKYLQTSMTL